MGVLASGWEDDGVGDGVTDRSSSSSSTVIDSAVSVYGGVWCIYSCNGYGISFSCEILRRFAIA